MTRFAKRLDRGVKLPINAGRPGYGKPPRATRFQKGRSGNPAGRRRGSKNLATILEEDLEQRVVIRENGKQKTITKRRASMKQLVNKAVSGEHRAMKLLLELVRAIGTNAQQLPSEDAGPNPLSLELMAQLRRRYEIDVAREASEARPPWPIRPLTRGTQ